MKLNQVIAVENSIKTRHKEELTKFYQQLQKAELLAGLARSYHSKTEDGDQLPPESKLVQLRVHQAINTIVESAGRAYDAMALKEYTNTQAKANVVVDDQVLLKDVPVIVLLQLERELVDVHTFVKKLPVLDPAERWDFDTAQDCYATEPTQTMRTKKVMRNHEKAPATEKHPAQVETYTEDVQVGTWTTIKYSGSMPATDIAQMLDRVEKLQRAVKVAMEEANSMNAVPQPKVGDAVLGYIFKNGKAK